MPRTLRSKAPIAFDIDSLKFDTTCKGAIQIQIACARSGDLPDPENKG